MSQSQPSPSGASGNAFAPEFLQRVHDLDEPYTAGEADLSGPWQVVAEADGWFAVQREGDLEPQGRYRLRELALLVAAALPMVGRGPLFRVEREPSEEGFALKLQRHDGLEVVGWLRHCDLELVQPLSALTYLMLLPWEFVNVLEAAGGTELERAGRLLWRRVAEQLASRGEGP